VKRLYDDLARVSWGSCLVSIDCAFAAAARNSCLSLPDASD